MGDEKKPTVVSVTTEHHEAGWGVPAHVEATVVLSDGTLVKADDYGAAPMNIFSDRPPMESKAIENAMEKVNK